MHSILKWYPAWGHIRTNPQCIKVTSGCELAWDHLKIHTVLKWDGGKILLDSGITHQHPDLSRNYDSYGWLIN